MEELGSKLDTLLREVQAIKTDTEELKKMKVLMEKLELLPQRIDNIEEEQLEISEELAECREELSKLKASQKIRDQYDRKDNLLISGITPPEEDEGDGEENLREIILNLAATLEVPLTDQDIKIAHRMPTKFDKTLIIAKLNNREKKVQLIRASKRKQLKYGDMKWEPEEQPIYCDDHLTKDSIKLLVKAKELKKDGQLKYVWVHDCSILFKVVEKGPITVLTSEHQLRGFKPVKKKEKAESSQQEAGAQSSNDSEQTQTETGNRGQRNRRSPNRNYHTGKGSGNYRSRTPSNRKNYNLRNAQHNGRNFMQD